MTKVVGVRFKKAGKIYDFNACDFHLPEGTSVIVETENGLIVGTVAREPQEIPGEDNGDSRNDGVSEQATEQSDTGPQEDAVDVQKPGDDPAAPESQPVKIVSAEDSAPTAPQSTQQQSSVEAVDDQQLPPSSADERDDSVAEQQEGTDDEPAEEDDWQPDEDDSSDEYDNRPNHCPRRNNNNQDGKKRVLKKVIRVADEQDFQTLEANRRREDTAYQFALSRIENRNLPIKLIDVEYLFDRSKAIFTFTADGRVDFRSLVKDLAAKLHTRIEMKQVRVRDEAKIIGGLGSCGRELCCSTFLNEFAPVSVRMAKEQSLALNPAKVSGLCGRLMCCLTYEHSLYHEMGKGMPKLGKNIETPRGRGRIIELNILQRRFRVALENGNIVTYTPDLLEEERALDKKGKLDLTVTPDQKLQQLEPKPEKDSDKDAEFEQITEMLPTSEIQLREERARKEKERGDRNQDRDSRSRKRPPRARGPRQEGSQDSMPAQRQGEQKREGEKSAGQPQEDKPRPAKRRRSRRKPRGQGPQGNNPQQKGGNQDGGPAKPGGNQTNPQGQRPPGDKPRPKRRRRPRGGNKKPTE